MTEWGWAAALIGWSAAGLMWWRHSQWRSRLKSAAHQLQGRYQAKRYYSLGGTRMLPDAEQGPEALEAVGLKVERDRAFLQSVIGHFGQAVVVANRRGEIILANDAAEQLSHHSPIGGDLLQWLTRVFPGHAEAWRTWADEDLETGECLAQLGDKTFRVRLSVLANDGSHLCQVEDVTRLHLQAATDGLTGLYNRRHFEELLRVEMAKAERHGDKYPLTLLMLDVDHFKSINDTYGHAVGDQVLMGVAEVIRALGRTSDAACRWGGEEFAILLPLTPMEGALIFSDRLRKTIEMRQFFPGQTNPVTISVGAATHRRGDNLYERADKALYDSKHAGRNCVTPAL